MSEDLIQHQYVNNGPANDSSGSGANAPSEDAYGVSPNQKVYDTTHQIDHLVEVVEIYFAEQVPKYKWEPKEEEYSINNRGTISDVAKRYEKEDRRNITVTPIGETKETYTKGDKLTVKWEQRVEDGVEYKKITKTSPKKKVWVVALCNGNTGKLSIEIHENKLDNEEQVYENPVKFLIGEDEKTKVEFTLNGTQTYAQEITLRPKSDEDLKTLIENIQKREKKNAFLFFKAEVTGTEDEIKYNGDSQEFLNQDGLRLEVKVCECSEYYFEDNVLKGPNVVTEKSGNKVKGHTGIQDIIAIILHRTAGSSITGAIGHTKGTHFYVEAARGVDGEIFQPIKLDQYSNHIMNQTARTAHLEIQTENSIGIEVIGMAYYKKGEDLYTIYDTKISDQSSVNLSKAYKGEHNIDGKWTATDIYWDQLTEAQIKSVKCIVVALMEKYNLKKENIFIHEEIQSKTAGEGGVVKEAIFPLLDDCI